MPGKYMFSFPDLAFPAKVRLWRQIAPLPIDFK